MRLSGYYSSGAFAKLAGVSVRTIRYYDQKNILKPSYVNPNGARFYTDTDLVRLQQILLFKYLGFSLEDIREMSVSAADRHMLKNALEQQAKLVQDRIEQMQLVAQAIQETGEALDEDDSQEPDWSRMLKLIHLTGMETSMKRQYQDATNLTARISLHQNYSINPQGWFPWIFEQCQITPGMKILELGCGNGALWMENIDCLPEKVSVTLSDISEGMIRDVRRTLGEKEQRFSYQVFDCAQLPFEPASFDLVIANHVLFYCEDIDLVCREISRVLRPGGRFVCSTYGSGHMKEISRLVQEFDSRIQLAANDLYERFGLQNGREQLQSEFSQVELRLYDDGILIDRPEPLVEYILSCHGNQNRYLLNRYSDFKHFMQRKVRHGIHITKEAGVFVCQV